jgi:hypothetical protein
MTFLGNGRGKERDEGNFGTAGRRRREGGGRGGGVGVEGGRERRKGGRKGGRTEGGKEGRRRVVE